MSPYQRIILLLFLSFLILVFSLLFIGGVKSDDRGAVMERLRSVTPDSLVQVIIAPLHPGRSKDLCRDTVWITDTSIVAEVTDRLNTMNERYRGRGLPDTWETLMVLDYVQGGDIRLRVVRSFEGVCVFLTNTMGKPRYRCDELQVVLERVVGHRKGEADGL